MTVNSLLHINLSFAQLSNLHNSTDYQQGSSQTEVVHYCTPDTIHDNLASCDLAAVETKMSRGQHMLTPRARRLNPSACRGEPSGDQPRRCRWPACWGQGCGACSSPQCSSTAGEERTSAARYSQYENQHAYVCPAYPTYTRLIRMTHRVGTCPLVLSNLSPRCSRSEVGT